MKIVKCLFFIVWTLWSIGGILSNYTRYRAEEWIVLIAVISFPYIVMLLCPIHKRRIRQRNEYPENPWENPPKYDDTDEYHG